MSTVLHALYRLLAAHLLVRASQSALAFAIAYWAFSTTQSVSLSAAALLARMGPSVLLSLYSGRLTDIHHPGRIYVLALLMQACLSVATAVYLQWSSSVVIAVVLALIALSSMIDSFVSSAFQRLALNAITDDTPNKTLINGRISLVDSAPPLIGPMLGAIGLQWTGMPGLYFLDALIAVVVALLLAPQAIARLQTTVQPATRVAWLHGIRVIFNDPLLRALQLLFSAQNLLNGIGSGLLAAFIIGTIGASKEQYATVVTAMAVGAVIGSLLASSIPVPDRQRLLVMMAALTVAALAGRTLLGVAPTIAIVGIGLSLRTLMGPMANAINQSLWLDRIDRSKQGTIFGARRLLSQGPFPLGVLLATLGPIILPMVPGMSVTAAGSSHVDALRWAYVALGLLELLTVVGAWRQIARLHLRHSAPPPSQGQP